MNSTMGSALPSNAIPVMVQDWGIRSRAQEVLPISTFLVGKLLIRSLLKLENLFTNNSTGYVFGELSTSPSPNRSLTRLLSPRAHLVGPFERALWPTTTIIGHLLNVLALDNGLCAVAELGGLPDLQTSGRCFRQRTSIDCRRRLGRHIRRPPDERPGHGGFHGCMYTRTPAFLDPFTLQLTYSDCRLPYLGLCLPQSSRDSVL